MRFDNIFGRSPLSGDVIPFKRRHVVGEEAFDWNHDIDEDALEHREPLDLYNMSEEELKIVVNHPKIHPDVRLYARLMLRENELRSLPPGTRARWDAATERRWNDALDALLRKQEAVFRAIPHKLRWEFRAKAEDVEIARHGRYNVWSDENPEDIFGFDRREEAMAYAQDMVEDGFSPNVEFFGKGLDVEAFLRGE